MLSTKDAMATVAVKDLAKAKRFYGDKLGLSQVGKALPGVVSYRSGAATIVIYESEFAGTNKATAATWVVGDEFDSIVRTLKNAGIVFEHYDLSGLERTGDIHVAGDFKAAWFKDPDGNILHINSM
jgi:catechol 2,3-dioxygenase-like lactoylglutathione lyase family enzyme